MEDLKYLMILDTITQHRAALAMLRKNLPVSKTDIEVLAFAKKAGVFNVYQLKQFYAHTNIQQLRTSVKRLENFGAINLVKPGVKNKPAYYLISFKGGEWISRYIQIIRYN